MNKELIFIGSVTRTVRARDILQKKGIKAIIERETSDENHGCGYGVIVVSGDIENARAILAEEGFDIK